MWHYAAIALVASGIGFGGGWTTRDWKAGADKAKELQQQVRDELRQAENRDRASADYEAKRATNAERVRVVTRTVERIVREPFYAGAAGCLDNDGLRLVQSAAAATNPAGKPAPAVPAASAP